MLKKLLANKIVLLCCGFLIVGIVIFFVASRDSKVHQKENHQVEEENTGLEIKDYVDGTVDSVDGSGSWDDTTDNNDQKTDTTPSNNDQKTDATPDNNNQKTDSTSDNNDQKTEDDTENNNTEDDRNETSEQENILEDDKEWSGIN